MAFGTIEQALEDVRQGRLVIVADDEDRESEGDLIGAKFFDEIGLGQIARDFFAPSVVQTTPLCDDRL